MDTAVAILILSLARLIVPFSLLLLFGSWVEKHLRRSVHL